MASATDNGQRVVCVSATAGEHGTADPETWPPQRLGQVRRLEAAAAMAVLGITEHRFLGLPDGALADHDAHGSTIVRRLLDEVQPDTILTFGPDGMTFHPDHIAVHRWVTNAWEQRGRPGRLLYATTTVEHLERFGHFYEANGTYMTDERPLGIPEVELALHLRLDGPGLDRKVTALAATASQTRNVIAAVGEEIYATLVAEEAFIDAFRAGTRRGTAAPAESLPAVVG
jgi:LmbE family N-acetylglucosaminyl deacetylase